MRRPPAPMITVVLASLLLSTASAQQPNCTVDGVSFARAGAVRFGLPTQQLGGNPVVPFMWEFSPCQPIADLCPLTPAGFLQYRTPSGCSTDTATFPNSTYGFATPFVVGQDGNDARFRFIRSDAIEGVGNVTTAVNVTVKCDPTGPAFAVTADPSVSVVMVEQPNPLLVEYLVQLRSRCACSGGCTYIPTEERPEGGCRVGGSDFSEVQPVFIDDGDYNNSVSLCRPVTSFTCPVPAYVQDDGCSTQFTRLLSLVQPDPKRVVFTYGTADGTASATVDVICDPVRERGVLRPQKGQDQDSQQFELASRCACPGACPAGRDYWHRGPGQGAVVQGAPVDYPEGYPGRALLDKNGQQPRYYAVNVSPRQCARACDAAPQCDSFSVGLEDSTCWLSAAAAGCGTAKGTLETYWLATGGQCPRQIRVETVMHLQEETAPAAKRQSRSSKNQAGTSGRRIGAKGRQAECTLTNGVQIEGTDVGSATVGSAEACCALCSDLGSTCAGFAWDATDRECRLKGSITGQAPKANSTSGTTSSAPTPPPTPPTPPPTPPPPPPPAKECRVQGMYFESVAKVKFALPLQHLSTNQSEDLEWEVSLCDSTATDLCPGAPPGHLQLRFPQNGTCSGMRFATTGLLAAGEDGATFVFEEEQASAVLVVSVQCDPDGLKYNLHPTAAATVETDKQSQQPVIRVALASRCACSGACGDAPTPPPDQRDCAVAGSSFANVLPIQFSLPVAVDGQAPPDPKAPTFTWGVSLCSNSSAVCPSLPPSLVQQRADDATLCSGADLTSMTALRSLSSYGSDDHTAVVFLLTTGDSKRSAVVTVQCDPFSNDQVLRPDPAMTAVRFSADHSVLALSLTSRCACPGGCASGARAYWSKGKGQTALTAGQTVQYPAGFPNRVSFNGTIYGRGITLVQCQQACDYAATAQCDSLTFSGSDQQSPGDCYLYKSSQQQCDTYAGPTTAYWLATGGACPKPAASAAKKKPPLLPRKQTQPGHPSEGAGRTRTRASVVADPNPSDPGCMIDDIDLSTAGSIRFQLPLRHANGTDDPTPALWYVNPCTATSDLCPVYPNGFVQFKAPGNQGCPNPTEPPNTFVNRTDLAVTGPGTGVQLTFTSSFDGGRTSQTVLVSVRCNPSGADGQLELDPRATEVTATGPPDHLVYTLQLQSLCACPGQCGRAVRLSNPMCAAGGGVDFTSVRPLDDQWASGERGTVRFVVAPCTGTNVCPPTTFVQRLEADYQTTETTGGNWDCADSFPGVLAFATEPTGNVTLMTFNNKFRTFTLRVQCDPDGERGVIAKDPKYHRLPIQVSTLNVTSRCACEGGCPPGRQYWHQGHGRISDPDGADVPYPEGYPGRTAYGGSYYGLLVSVEQCAIACDAMAQAKVPCTGFTWSKEVNGTCWLKSAASCSTKPAGDAGWTSYWLADSAPCPRASLAEVRRAIAAEAEGLAKSSRRAEESVGVGAGMVFPGGCPAEVAVAYQGTVLGAMAGPRADCCQLCAAVTGCVGFTHNSTACVFFGSITATSSAPGSVSGRIQASPTQCGSTQFAPVGPVRFTAPVLRDGTPAGVREFEVSLCGTTSDLCPGSAARPGHFLQRDPQTGQCAEAVFQEFTFLGSGQGADGVSFTHFQFAESGVGVVRVHVRCMAIGSPDAAYPLPAAYVTANGTAPNMRYDVSLQSQAACSPVTTANPVTALNLDCSIDGQVFYTQPAFVVSAPIDGSSGPPFTWMVSPCAAANSVCPGARPPALLLQADNAFAPGTAAPCDRQGLLSLDQVAAISTGPGKDQPTVFVLTSSTDASARLELIVSCGNYAAPVVDPRYPSVTVANGTYRLHLLYRCACSGLCAITGPPGQYWTLGGLASDPGRPLDFPGQLPAPVRVQQKGLGNWCAGNVTLDSCKQACDQLQPECDSLSWEEGLVSDSVHYGVCCLYHGSSCTTYQSPSGAATYWRSGGTCSDPQISAAKMSAAEKKTRESVSLLL